MLAAARISSRHSAMEHEAQKAGQEFQVGVGGDQHGFTAFEVKTP
ncbi:Uncharacterised protein [Mycobacterium tuberculosis]|uniref:Uncharacterized protein n=1 Tax=Mycobacterium tuberculosis TaxID=1773 RepID=A0A916PCU0_MYCTX|nr:Uncharacterised protein [Mycobacterium tuberculosis]